MAAPVKKKDEDWVDDWEDEVIPEPEPVAEEPSLLRRGWDAISQPLTDLPSRMVKPIADWVDAPDLDTSNFGTQLKGFGAGALQGAGDLITSFTSPLELGMGAATLGSGMLAKRGLQGAASGVNAIGRGLSGLETAHGAGEVFSPNSTLTERGMGLAEMAGGIAGMRHSPSIPEPEIIPSVRRNPGQVIPEPNPSSLIPEQTIELQSRTIPEEVIPEQFLLPELEKSSSAPNLVDDVSNWIDDEIDTALGSSVPETPAVQNIPEPPAVPETVIPKPILRSQGPVDYSPTAEIAARKKLIDAGARPEDLAGMSNKQIIDTANPPAKPKVKMRLNKETNSLEPDLDDPLTAKLFTSARSNKPVPEFERLNPDTEIDINEAWNMADAHQPDLMRPDFKPSSEFLPTDPNPINRKDPLADSRQGFFRTKEFPESDGKPINRKEAFKLKTAGQGELPGNLRQSQPAKMIPGGRPSKPIVETKLQQWMGIPRAIQSAMDLSFPLRQGLPLIHTKGWWKAWPDMVKSFGSEATYKGVMDSIAERPNFRGREITLRDGTKKVEQSLAQKAGLAITDLTSHREESIGSSLAEKIPGLGRGIRGSNRAYNAFANKLRADTFDDLIAKNPAAKTNLVLAKELANYVNNASGRGDLGALEKSATVLNNMLFSPRLMASRAQMLNPKNYIYTRPEVRKEYMKSALASAGTWLSLAGMAKAAGAEVSMDMESSDFGKLKFGDTRLDPAAGFQQYIVLAARLAKGGAQKVLGDKDGRYSSGKPFAPTFAGDIGNFFSNKMSPNLRLATGPFTANKAQPFEVGDNVLRTFTPIMLQDVSEILQENPELAWALIPGAVGVGNNTYRPGKQSPTLIPPSLGWNRKKDITIR